MFSVITNIYNKQTKGPTVMELFTATGKLKKFFWQLEMFDVCTTDDTVHIDTIFNFLSHTRQHGCIDIIHCCNDSVNSWPLYRAYFPNPVKNNQQTLKAIFYCAHWVTVTCFGTKMPSSGGYTFLVSYSSFLVCVSGGFGIVWPLSSECVG
jgi:hypothetical protein